MLLSTRVRKYGLLLFVLLLLAVASNHNVKAESSPNAHPMYDFTDLDDLDINSLKLFGKIEIPTFGIGSRLAQLGSGIQSLGKRIALGSRLSQLGTGIRTVSRKIGGTIKSAGQKIGGTIKSAGQTIGGTISSIARGITSRIRFPRISFSSLKFGLRFPNFTSITSRFRFPRRYSPTQLFEKVPFIGKGRFVDTTANVPLKANEDSVAYGLDVNKIDFGYIVVIHEKVKKAGEKARLEKGEYV